MIQINKIPNFDASKLAQIKAVFALSNPGAKFKYTRHNVGALFVEVIAEKNSQTLISEKNFSFFELNIGSKNIIFSRTDTFMNSSGIGLKELMKKFNLKPENVLIVHDELEKDFPKIGFGSGSHKGHNGMRSVFEQTGATTFYRLKFGIGRPENKNDVPTFVLEKFSKDQVDTLIETFQEVLTSLETFFQEN